MHPNITSSSLSGQAGALQRRFGDDGAELSRGGILQGSAEAADGRSAAAYQIDILHFLPPSPFDGIKSGQRNELNN
jgi:hypothetical protein